MKPPSTPSEIRKLWSNPETRRVNPVAHIAAAILNSKREDLVAIQSSTSSLIAAKTTLKNAISEYSRAQRAFLADLYSARAVLSWVYANKTCKESGLTFEDVRSVLGRSPASLYNAIHNSLDIDMSRALMHGTNYVCPLCETKVG